jgi:hypothetical protein
VSETYHPTIDFSSSPTICDFLADEESFFRIIVGPVGSGKSTACTTELMRIACMQDVDPRTNYRYSRFAIIRNTQPDLKTTTINTWLENWKEEMCGPLTRGSPITHHIKIKPKNGKPGLDAEFIFLALDHDRDIRKLKSLDLTAAWVNEGSEVQRAVSIMLQRRVGRYPKREDAVGIVARRPCVIFDTNAPDEDHWLVKLEREEKPLGWAFYHQPPAVLEVREAAKGFECIEPELWLRGQKFNANKVIKGAKHYFVLNPLAENLANLRARYYEDQISGSKLDEIRCMMQARYVYVQSGKPCIPDYVDEVFALDDVPILDDIDQQLGLDIGNTLQPAAVIGQRHPRGIWLIHDEVVSPDMGLDNFSNLLLQSVKERYKKLNIGNAWGDPAGIARDPIYEVVAFDHLTSKNIPARPAASNDPTLRIEAITSALTRVIDGKPGLMIHRRCKVLRKALSGAWHYRRLRIVGEEARYADVPYKNHPYSDVGDALGYLLLGGGEHRQLSHGSRPKPTAAQAKIEFDVFG